MTDTLLGRQFSRRGNPDFQESDEMRLAKLFFLVATTFLSVTACTDSKKPVTPENAPRTAGEPRKRDAAVADWSSLSAEVSTTLAFISSRIDVLATPGASTQKIDRATLDAARTSLAAIEKTWVEAQDKFSSGNAAAAAQKADIVKRKSAEILKKLGVAPG